MYARKYLSITRDASVREKTSPWFPYMWKAFAEAVRLQILGLWWIMLSVVRVKGIFINLAPDPHLQFVKSPEAAVYGWEERYTRVLISTFEFYNNGPDVGVADQLNSWVNRVGM
jgi:hypothetical protein